MVVMALGGLWHGAGATFVLWGVYHGAALALYHSTRRWWDSAPTFVQRAATFLIVVLGWVLFRASTVTDALLMYRSMFAPVEYATAFAPVEVLNFSLSTTFVVAVLALVAVSQFAKPSTDIRFRPTWRHASMAAVLVTVSVILLRDGSPFLYYQF